jgi:HSP20 family protein
MEDVNMITKRFLNIPTRGWHHPFAELERMARQMDQLSNAFIGRSGYRFVPARVFPSVNISEDVDKYYLRAELPGIKTENVDLQVNGRSLTISGERKIKTEADNVKYHRKEREEGKFSRVIEFPGDINANDVSAKMVNGVLTVTVAKSEAAKPRRITVH